MKENFREYLASSLIQYLIKLLFLFLSMFSVIFLLYYIVLNFGTNIINIILVIVVYILLNLVCKFIYYFFAYKNSNENILGDFVKGLNNLINTNIGYTCDFRLFDIDKMVNRLNNNRYREEEENIYVKEMKYSFIVKHIYNEPSVKKYKLIYHLYKENNNYINLKKDVISYSVLVINEDDYNQSQKHYLKMYNACIVYNANGIIFQHFSFLSIDSSNLKLDFFSKIFYRIYKKNFKIFLSKETYKIIRNINKKIV